MDERVPQDTFHSEQRNEPQSIPSEEPLKPHQILLTRMSADNEFAQHWQQWVTETYILFHDPIHRYVARRIPASDVEDVVQTVFEKITKAYECGVYTPNENLQGWVFKVAHSTVVDHLRRRHDTAQLTDDIPVLTPFRNETRQEIIIDFINTITTLLGRKAAARRQVAVFQLHLLGMNYAEIGELFGLKEGAVKQLAYRAMVNCMKIAKENNIEVPDGFWDSL